MRGWPHPYVQLLLSAISTRDVVQIGGAFRRASLASKLCLIFLLNIPNAVPVEHST